MPTDLRPTPTHPEQFTGAVEAIAASLHVLRETLVGAVSSVTDPQHPRTLARELGINRGLAWRVSRALAEPSAGEALLALPRPKSLALLLDACTRRGAPEGAIGAARAAVIELEAAIRRSGEARRSLPSLLIAAGLDGPGCSHFAAARQRLFEGSRILWGVEAGTGLRLMIAWPGRAGHLDGAVVRGTVDLTALRHGPWPISYATTVDENNVERRLAQHPIDDVPAAKLPFIRRFCSPRDIHAVTDEARGMRRYLVTPPAVGQAGRMTCVLGTTMRDLHEEAPLATDPPACMMMIVETPMHRCQFDLLVHEELELTTPPRVILCDRLTRPHGFDFSRVESERLPLEGSLVPLGRGAAAMAAPHVPWYTELVEHVIGRIGFEPERFLGHRWELSHPPIATAALLQFRAARRRPGEAPVAAPVVASADALRSGTRPRGTAPPATRRR